ncbi:MAG: Secretion system C-terminal sorting domain, partial [Bacteroidota bacterium]
IQIEADSFYETTIDWGDGSTSTNFQTAYSDSSELFFAQHLYAQSQPYQITVSTRGCKDTLVYELVQEAHVPDNNDAELSMFPNPTLGFFKIKIPTNELLNLEVTDAFGKLVYQFKDVSLFNGFDVDLTMKPVGQYHIRITGKARSWVGKVVKI